MHTVEQARARWNATFSSGSDLSALRAAVRSNNERNPCIKGLRSVCWKAFLVFENLDRSTWPKTISNSRSAYGSLKEHFLRGIKDPDAASAVDPLADDATSPWNTLRQDELLREEILQDVERCMPDNTFFREPSNQTFLLDILFIFCKLNADVGYRQGMHELLAPILWVVTNDAIDTKGEAPKAEDRLMYSTLDQRYIEHDAFTLFCLVMQTAKSFYETMGPSRKTSATPMDSPIVVRSKRIHEQYLQRTDPELTEHLTAIDILPQIFVIRWIRLLFGREFPLDDVLAVWDILFAEDPALNLVDLVCVAMLLRIRWQLLEADYTSALTLLLRYPVPPPEHSPMTFVEDALFLKSHLSVEGGRSLVRKYTGDAPNLNSPTRRLERPARSSLHTPQGSTDQSRMGPMRSPSQFLQDSGGIEGILQEAAKGVYKRSERWGVNQALRGAVQQLQEAANNSPRPSIGAARWSLDEGILISDNEQMLTARILDLEERNKHLAKMLHDTMEDLTEQARKFDEEKAEAAANALTLAVAKLQFVHVYLENSSLPLHDESSEQVHEDGAERKSQGRGTESDTTANKSSGPQTTPSKTAADIKKAASPSPIRNPSLRPLPEPSKAIPESPTRTYVPGRRRPALKRLTDKSLSPSPDPPLESPFQQSRPSLAQSSFSWMLGEDQATPSFVSASPFSPEKERRQSSESKTVARKKASFLFGEEKKAQKDDTKPRGPKVREDDEGEDGFTMGTLSAPGASVSPSSEPQNG